MSNWSPTPPGPPQPGQPQAPMPPGYQQPYGGQYYDAQQHAGPPYQGVVYGQSRASFGSRLAGSLIDGLVATGVILVVAIPLVVVGFVGSSLEDSVCQTAQGSPYTCSQPTGGTVALWLLLGLVYIVAALAVTFFLLIRPVAKTGQTIGRRAMNIKVVDQHTGELLSMGRAIGRYAFASFISAQIFYIGYLWMLWDDNKQTLHDKVLNSVVIKV